MNKVYILTPRKLSYFTTMFVVAENERYARELAEELEYTRNTNIPYGYSWLNPEFADCNLVDLDDQQKVLAVLHA